MKKIASAIIAALMMTATVSQANPNHHYGHRHQGHHGGYGWVAPLVIGGVVGYAIATRPQPVIVQQPVYPTAPLGYHYEQILDANCNCYRIVLVPN